MFIQNYLKGKLYRNGNTYTLKIGKKEYSGDSVESVLDKYTKHEAKKAKKQEKKES